jgi:hypothetical protein
MNFVIQRYANDCPKQPVLKDLNSWISQERPFGMLVNGNVASLECAGKESVYRELTPDGRTVVLLENREYQTSYLTREFEVTWVAGLDMVLKVRLDRNGKTHGIVRIWRGPERTYSACAMKVRGYIQGWSALHDDWFILDRFVSKKKYLEQLPRPEQLARVLPISVSKRVCSFL